ncbi:unnamed protein product [Moneuplotes crassus]|uniref:Uncharacterized protein n=1 Tax=Euplotes crassus TaxID=5936 RepID=A0AAD1XSD7_EUPCR|nr:unnamed protein product [Moneuplotes crassus]
MEKKSGLTEDALDTDQESIQQAGEYMIKYEIEHDLGKEVADLWAQVEANTKGFRKHLLCCAADYCVNKLKNPESKLFLTLMDHLNQCVKYHENNRRLISAWCRNDIISEDHKNHLIKELEAYQESRRKSNEVYFKAQSKEKQFAIYLRNFKQCSANSEVYREELQAMLQSKSHTPQQVYELIEKFHKTLLSLKCNRRAAAKLAIEFTKEFRQSITVRLHCLENIKELQRKVKGELEIRQKKDPEKKPQKE